MPVVEERKDHPEQHLRHTQQYRQLHFERVLVGDLIDGHLPNGVQSDRIRGATIAGRPLRGQHERFLVAGGVGRVQTATPPRAEHVDRLGEDVVVDEAGVD